MQGGDCLYYNEPQSNAVDCTVGDQAPMLSPEVPSIRHGYAPLKENGYNQMHETQPKYAPVGQNRYSTPNGEPIQTVPNHNNYQQKPKDMNMLIKEMFARKGISLDHSIKLGSGRYSKVITAQHLSGKTVAIKMINKRGVTTDFRNKFLPREIACWKRLTHRNLVRIGGHYEAMGYVFLLMEYGPGGDMLSYVQTKGPVAEGQAAFWMKEICAGLSHMHALDTAHRDLKLENIIIFGRHVKIADFGFARKVNNEMSYTFCGSKSYSAPEILMGEPYNAFKSDVWSLGVVAFVMCTDLMPYRENCSNSKIVEAQKNRSYKFPSTLNLSEACRTTIDLLMTFDGAERPTLFDASHMPWILNAQLDTTLQPYQRHATPVVLPVPPPVPTNMPVHYYGHPQQGYPMQQVPQHAVHYQQQQHPVAPVQHNRQPGNQQIYAPPGQQYRVQNNENNVPPHPQSQYYQQHQQSAYVGMSQRYPDHQRNH